MYKNAVIPAMEPESRSFNRSRKPYLNLDSRFTVRCAGCPGMTKRGFTLIELLVVVLIIGILAAVALPQYQMAVYKSRFVKIQPLVNSLVAAQEIYYMANGQYSKDLSELDIDYPSACTYTQHPNWSYDVLNCPDVYVTVSRDYNGIDAQVKKWPKSGGVCVSYVVPYQKHHAIMGEYPSCVPYGEKDSAQYKFGERVCQSMSVRKEINQWRTFYYL